MMPVYTDFVLDFEIRYTMGWVSVTLLGAQLMLVTFIIFADGFRTLQLLAKKLYNKYKKLTNKQSGKKYVADEKAEADREGKSVD